MFARSHRLRRSRDVVAVVQHGTRTTTSHLRLYWRNRAITQPARGVIVVGKKVHKSAVVRNRLKRRLRAALKEVRPPAGIDYVVLPKLNVLDLPFTILTDEISFIMAKIPRR